jgi:cytochrome c553
MQFNQSQKPMVIPSKHSPSEESVAVDSRVSRLSNSVLGAVALCVVAACAACSGSDDSTASGGSFWTTATYSPPAAPLTAAYHDASKATACMTCHGPTGTATTKIVYGGIVYQADGVTPAANVQVGVSDGTYKSEVYSATNGLYWGVVPATGAPTVNWPVTDIRVRSAVGESIKAPNNSSTRQADCDLCHTGALALKAP